MARERREARERELSLSCHFVCFVGVNLTQAIPTVLGQALGDKDTL